MNIDRELLEDIGFVKGNGWDHEVWVYDGFFWVHFPKDGHPLQTVMAENEIRADGCSRLAFIRKFIKAVEEEVRDSARVEFT